MTTSSTTLQLAVPLSGVNQQLTHLELWLLAIAVLGVLIAVILGFAVARYGNPTFDAVTEGDRGGGRVHRPDPTARRGRGRCSSVGSGARSTGCSPRSTDPRSGEPSVLDAYHKLRTPLTSLKTNTEVLRRVDKLDAEDPRTAA